MKRQRTRALDELEQMIAARVARPRGAGQPGERLVTEEQAEAIWGILARAGCLVDALAYQGADPDLLALAADTEEAGRGERITTTTSQVIEGLVEN